MYHRNSRRERNVKAFSDSEFMSQILQPDPVFIFADGASSSALGYAVSPSPLNGFFSFVVPLLKINGSVIHNHKFGC